MNLKKPSNSIILATLASLFLGSLANATPMQEISMGIQRAKPVEEKFVNISTEYGVSSNFNRPERPRAYTHSLSLGLSRKVFEDYNASVSAGVQYMTMNDDVYRDSEQDSYYQWNDISVTLMRAFKTQDLKHSLAVSGTTDFLVSEESRYLGYRGIAGGSVVYNWSVWPKVTLKQSLSAGYILNRFKYSRVGGGGGGGASRSAKPGEINPDGYYGYGIGPIFQVLKGLRLGYTISVRGTHYLDNSNLYGFGNTVSLTYSRDQWSLYARYTNRGYAERGETNLWFTDEYRRLASAGMIYNF